VESRRVRKEILELSRKHPRYGYRRITAVLRRDGFEVNAKRVQRIRRQEALQVSKRQRRMKRLGVSTSVRQRAAQTNDVWSWDFVEDQTENGTRFRMLTLIDEHTRRCLAVHAGWSIRAVDVITIVEAAFVRYGRPQHLRSDNGPEFIAYAIQDWLKEQEIKTIYIRPGSPWENGHGVRPGASARESGKVARRHRRRRSRTRTRYRQSGEPLDRGPRDWPGLPVRQSV
jgi:putative transposase